MHTIHTYNARGGRSSMYRTWSCDWPKSGCDFTTTLVSCWWPCDLGKIYRSHVICSIWDKYGKPHPCQTNNCHIYNVTCRVTISVAAVSMALISFVPRPHSEKYWSRGTRPPLAWADIISLLKKLYMTCNEGSDTFAFRWALFRDCVTPFSMLVPGAADGVVSLPTSPSPPCWTFSLPGWENCLRWSGYHY